MHFRGSTTAIKANIFAIAVVSLATASLLIGQITVSPRFGDQPFSTCNGRLTLQSGTAVSTTDQIGKSVVYFTPFNGNRVYLYNGSGWIGYTLSEISLTLSALTSGKNYDVFAYSNSGTLTLELSAAWTNDTTPSDSITTQDGISVKAADTSRRWVGTIRTTGTTTTEDSGGGSTTQVGGKRFVWNVYNKVRRAITVIDTTDSWAYTTNTWRQADAASGNKVEWVTGDGSLLVDAVVTANVFTFTGNAVNSKAGVAIDSTTAPSGVRGAAAIAATPGGMSSMTSTYRGTPGVGYHYAAWLEKGADSSCVFVGDSGGDGTQSGLNAIIEN